MTQIFNFLDANIASILFFTAALYLIWRVVKLLAAWIVTNELKKDLHLIVTINEVLKIKKENLKKPIPLQLTEAHDLKKEKISDLEVFNKKNSTLPAATEGIHPQQSDLRQNIEQCEKLIYELNNNALEFVAKELTSLTKAIDDNDLEIKKHVKAIATLQSF